MKNFAKTLLALMLALCLLTTFVACGDTEEEPNTPPAEEEPGDTPGDEPGDEPSTPSTPLNNAGVDTGNGWSDIK